LASLVAHAAATSWFFRGNGKRGEALEESAVGGLLVEIASILFYVGVPLIALLSGAISLDLMGLGRLWSSGDGAYTLGFTLGDWLRAAGEGAGAVALALAVLAISRRGAGLTAPGEGLASAALNAVRDEVHGLFYRAPGTVLLSDPLFGAAIGFVLMIFEWFLHPRFIARKLPREQRWHLMVRILCALVSGTLYLGTRNFWVMLLAGFVIRAAGERLAIERGPSRIQA
jgi:hypothetical protein